MVLHIGTWGASLFLLIGAILFFIVAVVNRQLNNFGMSFNGLMGQVFGLGSYAIVGWFFSTKWGFIVGLIASLVAGLVSGQMMGGSDDGG